MKYFDKVIWLIVVLTACAAQDSPDPPKPPAVSVTVVKVDAITLKVEIRDISMIQFEIFSPANGSTIRIFNRSEDMMYTLDNLMRSTSYNITVQGYANGSLSTDLALTTSVGPSAPGNLTASEKWTDRLMIAWSPSVPALGNISRYLIYYQKLGEPSRMNTSRNNQYLLTGLERNTTYLIQVQAEDDSGIGLGEKLQVSTLFESGALVVSLLTRGVAFLRLRLDAPMFGGFLPSYFLGTYRKTVGSESTQSFNVSGGVVKIQHLDNATSYTITATAFYSDPLYRTSTATVELSTLARRGAPSAVSNVVMTPVMYHESDSVLLSWSEPSNTEGSDPDNMLYHVVYCLMNPIGSFNVCRSANTTVGVTRAVLTDLVDGRRYHLLVRSSGEFGQAGADFTRTFSFAGKSDTCRAAMFTCRNLKCVPWGKMCDRYDDCGDRSDEMHDTAGCSLPPQVLMIKTEEHWSSIDVTWRRVDELMYGVLEYMAFAAYVNEPDRSKIMVTVQVPANASVNLTAAIPGLEMNTTYDIYVVAVNMAGSSTYQTFPRTTTLLGLPSSPQSLVSKATLGWESSSVTLRWNVPEHLNNNRETFVRYNVHFCLETVSASTLNHSLCGFQTAGSDKSVVLTALSSGQLYWAKVVAVSEAGMDGGDVTMMFHTERQNSAASMPRDLAIAATKKSLSLTWRKPEATAGVLDEHLQYMVSICERKNPALCLHFDVPGYFYKIEKLEEDRAYVVRIAVYDQGGVLGSPVEAVVSTEKGFANWKIAVIIFCVAAGVILLTILVIIKHLSTRAVKSGSSKPKPVTVSKSRTAEEGV